MKTKVAIVTIALIALTSTACASPRHVSPISGGQKRPTEPTRILCGAAMRICGHTGSQR